MEKRSETGQQTSLRLVTHDDVASDLPPDATAPAHLSELIAQMLGEFGAFDGQDTAFMADATASAVAATLRLATGDAGLTGQASVSLGQQHDPAEDEQVSGVRAELTAAMAQIAGEGQLGAARALRSLAVYGGPFERHATKHLDSLASTGAVQAPDRTGSEIGRAEVLSTSLLSFIPGDTDELVLELGYATASNTRVGIVVRLDTFAGHQPSDALICDDLDGYLAELAGQDLPDVSTELPVAEAMGLLHHGFWIFDHTLDAADHLDDEADLLLARPLLDRLLATHPRIDYEPPDVTPTERGDAVAAFTKWAAVEAPDLLAEVSDYAALLIDFAADRALDPLRWSQVVAVDFLHYACHRVVAPPDDLACLPDVVRLMIRWSHEQKSWPIDVTNETLDAVDRVQPLFEAEIHGQLGDLASAALADVTSIDDFAPDLGLELVDPPIGGKHPEPFADERMADETRRQRAIAIAEEATDRALDLFDAEFATLVRRMTADLACLPKSPIGRGRISIWASAVVYAVSQLNDIPGGWSPLAMAATDITDVLDGAPGTITSKAKTVRNLLGAETFPPRARYQHSSSTITTGELMTSIMNLARFMVPDVLPGAGRATGSAHPPGVGAEALPVSGPGLIGGVGYREGTD